MDCTRNSDALSDAAAGGPVSAALGIHLESCAGCRRELAVLQEMLRLGEQELARASAAEPSPGFLQRIRAAVAQSSGTQGYLTLWHWASVAAASVLGIALLLFVSVPSPQSTTDVAKALKPLPTQAALEQGPGTAAAPEEPIETKLPGGMTSPGGHSSIRAEPVEARVLVPVGQLQALTELLAHVGEVELAGDIPGAAPQNLVPMAALVPISIKPIEIVPLDPPLHFGT